MTVYYNNFVFISDITSILKETPDKDELYDLLVGISDKWYDIGLSLQVRRDFLDDLKNSQEDDEDKVIAVIDNFLINKPCSVTWETVITAIESPNVNNKETADQIHRYLRGKNNKLLLGY